MNRLMIPPRTPTPWFNIELYRPRMEVQGGHKFSKTPPAVEKSMTKENVSTEPTLKEYPRKRRAYPVLSLGWLFTI